MKAWLFQDTRQKQKHCEKAPWYVGFYDPDGKKVRKRIGSKSFEALSKYIKHIVQFAFHDRAHRVQSIFESACFDNL